MELIAFIVLVICGIQSVRHLINITNESALAAAEGRGAEMDLFDMIFIIVTIFMWMAFILMGNLHGVE